jgi:hypothetical protein
MSPDDAAAFLGPEPPKQPAMGAFNSDQAASFLAPAVAANDAYRQAATTPDMPGSTPEFDMALQHTAAARVLDAFGQGAKNAYGTDDLGLSPETSEALKKAGILPDVAKGQGGIIRALNEAVIRPAAAAVDAAMRIPSAVLGGLTGAATQTATEVGGEQFGRGVGGLLEATTADVGSRIPAHAAPHLADMEEARNVGALGAPESAYFDTSPVPDAAVNENAVGAPRPKPAEPAAEPAVPGSPATAEPAALAPPAAPTDVHGLARQIAPETFNEYDALQQHQDGLRQQVADRQAELRQQAAAQAPHAAEIADLQDRVQDTTPRLAKKYQARLDALIPERDAFLNDDFTMGALTRDTPEIASLRQQLLETDFRMRDLAPDVSAAYRQAAEQMPAAPEPEPAGPVTALGNPIAEQDQGVAAGNSQAEPPAVAAQPAPVQPELTPVANPGEPARSIPVPAAATSSADLRPPVVSIAADVASKLQAAGRPAEEASAAGQVTEALWSTRAAAFEGKKGTAAEMYSREAPDIRSGAGQAVPRVAAPAVDRVVGYRTAKGSQYVVGEDGTTVRNKAARTDVGHEGDFGVKERSARTIYVDGNASSLSAAGLSGIGARGARVVIRDGKASLATWNDGAGKWGVSPGARDIAFSTTPEVGKHPLELWQPKGDVPGHTEAYAGMHAGNAITEIARSSDVAASRVSELAQGAQGKIRLTQDGPAVITLMRTANASTYLHEMGHDWLERMMRDGADPEAPAAMKADAGTVRKYLGLNDGDALSTRAHEKFARSFERYFMEGRAPTQALADVFAKFKDWLTTIYQTVARLKAPITPDIRDVFDQLLTTDPEARASIVPEAAAEQGELPTGGTMESRTATPLFPKPPKEPTRLVGFLRRLGGVRDEGGEVSAMLGSPKARPGLISSTGMSLDEAAIKAHEAGYFPNHGEDVPSERDMLDAIEGDLRGEPRYSAEDQVAAAAYQEAIDHNAEVDRMAQDHGIDTAGMTREQFFEALSERVSLERQAEEIRSMDEAHSAQYGEAVDDARHWLEDQGHDWNSHEFFGADDQPTPELERDYAAENAARAASQQLPGSGEPGPAAGPEGPVQDGGGQGGRDPGDAGRAGEESGPAAGHDVRGEPAAGTGAGVGAEQPTGPHQPLARTDDPLIDKAGNIRLDNLNRPEDVKAALRDLAEQHAGFMDSRGGVISDIDRRAMADGLGLTMDNFSPRKPEGISSSVWAEAVQKLTVQATDSLAGMASKFAESGSEADGMAYTQAKQRLLMVADHFASVTAEAGRTLRVFNKADMAFANSIADTLSAENNGRTLFQMQKEAKAVSLLETPAQAAKFMQDSQKASRGDMLLEYWINGLISNPITHATYMTALQIMTAMKAVPDTAAAAAFGSVREMMGGTEPRVYWGEVGAQLHGIIAGQRNGVRAAWKAAQTGLTTELPGESLAGAQGSFLAAQQPRGAIPGMVGQVVRAPARGVAVLHSYNRAIGYSQEIATQAYRQAASEDLEGVAFSARVADLTMNPTEPMMASARDAATSQTLMSRPGNLVQKVSQLTNARVNLPLLGSTPLGKFIDPFVSIGANVMSQALLERSPLGLMDAGIRDNLMGRNGAVARDQQIARISVGAAIGAATAGLIGQGALSGSGPTDPKEQQAWRLSGNQPYSVRIGDTWYGYHRLGSFGMMLGVTADMHQAIDALADHDVSHVASMIVGSLAKNLLDESFMKGPADLMRAVDDNDRYGARYVRDELGSFLPFSGALAQAAKSTDPFLREARTTLDSIKERIPGLRETLYPRNDIWGQPMRAPAQFGFGLTAVQESPVNNDPVDAAMQRLGNYPGMPEHQIMGVRLSDKQYDDYSRIRGRTARMMLNGMVTPSFQALPDGMQDKAMRERWTKATEFAQSAVKMQDAADAIREGRPSIIQQAVANKKLMATEGRHAATEARKE